MNQKPDRLGKKFGEVVKQYEKARQVYPKEIFVFLKSLLKLKKSKILDLGCGTGISTRQLVGFGEVTGCDPDVRMLKAAKAHKNSGVKKYVIGSAEKLPFKNESFDVVAAFASFHWYGNKKSIREIKRVLKPGGIFFIVHRNGIRSWGQGYRRAIIKTIKIEIADFKKLIYNPEKILKQNWFGKIITKTWPKKEIYSLKNSLEYVQSVSIWNSVPAALREKALHGLKGYFEKIKHTKGKIERRLTVKAVVGFK